MVSCQSPSAAPIRPLRLHYGVYARPALHLLRMRFAIGQRLQNPSRNHAGRLRMP